MRIGTRMRTGRYGLARARFRGASAIRAAVVVIWALALASASQASPEAPGGAPSLLPEAAVLFWLALSAAASWLLTLHLRRRWRQHGMAMRDPEHDEEALDADERTAESGLERRSESEKWRIEPGNRQRIQPEHLRPTASDPWQIDEAVGRLVAAANRLSAHADLIELTDRLNDLAERMEKPLSALELALAPRADRAATETEIATRPGIETEIPIGPQIGTGPQIETRPETENPAAPRPAAGARFAFADPPPPTTGDYVGGEFPESEDDELVGVEPRGLFELESTRSFTEAVRVPTPGGRARTRPPAEPSTGREALEITALGIGDSEALEPEA